MGVNLPSRGVRVMKTLDSDNQPLGEDDKKKTKQSVSVRQYSIVAICIFMQALVIGAYLYSFTLWVKPWSAEFSASSTEIMLVPTIFLYANAIVFFFLGKYLDAFPRRTVVITGLLCFSLSMFLISISSTLSFIYLVYLIIVPVAVLFAGPAAAITLASQVFEERRGLAIGAVGLGTSIGGIVMPHFAAFAIEDWGWRSANQALAIFGLVLIPFAFIALGATKRVTIDEKTEQEAQREPSRVFFRRPEFWLCILASTGAYFVFMAVQLNMAPIALEYDFATEETAFTISLFTAGMFIGKLLAGFLSDRIDARIVFLGIGFLMVAALFLMTMQFGHPVLLAAFFLFGIGAGGVIPLKAILLAGLFGPKHLGRVMGLAAPFVTLYSLGPIFAAFVWDIYKSYVPVLYVMIAILVLTVPFVLRLPKMVPATHAPGK